MEGKGLGCAFYILHGAEPDDDCRVRGEGEGFTHAKLIVHGQPRMCSDVTFSLAQYSTTPPRTNVDPQGCTVHAK